MILFSRITGNPKLLFLCFWLVVLLLYFPANQAGLYEDIVSYIGLQREMDFLSYINYMKHSLYQGVFTVHYLFICLFGTHPFPWFVAFTLLHALNGFLLFCFLSSLFHFMGWEGAEKVFFTGTLLFLITPLATEPVIWKACSHYLISTGIIFQVLRWTLAYLREPETKYLVLISILYYLSTFFLEIFYLTPCFVLILLFALRFSDRVDKAGVRKGLLNIFLPLILLLLVYFITLRLTLNQNIGRADFDLARLLSPSHVLSRLNKFLAHIYFMEYFLPLRWKQSFYRFTEHSAVIMASGLLLLGGIGYGTWKFRRMPDRARILFTLFLMGLSSCMIILPMWFYDLFPYQGNRYYYLACAFFYPFLAGLIFYHKGAMKSRWLIMGIYMSAFLCGAYFLILRARGATKVYYSIMDNFRWQKADTVLLLNLPVMYEGFGMLGAGHPSNFNFHLGAFRKDTIRGKAYDVSSYNMKSVPDGCHVKVLDSLQLVVTPNQYGSWWWFAGFGAADHENEMYQFKLIDNGFSYLIRFRQKPSAGTVVLFQTGMDWKEVNWNRTGEEQW